MVTTARGQFAPTVRDDMPAPSRRRTAPSMPPGYRLGTLLGRGGMGEVVLAHDTKIGRDVAIKRLNTDDADADLLARFLCEAQIQARLQHPAIVPVHEIGEDAHGRPYFTMKRIAGKTLGELIDDPSTRLQRLLRALVDICLAVDFAHARGVIHRDLKPANIMLGDYGEVYVLDWGVARVVGNSTRPAVDHHTEVGAMLGTPGYAAPEQLLRASDVTTAADVYAIGTLLYEILTRKPLHPRGMLAIASTLNEPTRAPSQQDPAIAPELDSLCVAALAADAAERPTARAIAEALQRYLDGDRDIERRRSLAADLLDVARAALASGDAERRGEAIRAAGRALAIDPDSSAAEVLESLLAESPATYAPSLAGRLRRADTEYAARGAFSLAVALSTYFLLLPLTLWVGVTDTIVVAAVFGYAAAQVLYNVWIRRTSRVPSALAFTANIVLALLLERMFGPFVLVPAIVLAYAVLSARQSTLIDRPWLLVGVAVVAFTLPLVLEAFGILASTWTTSGGALVIHSAALNLEGSRGAALLIAVNLVPIVVAVCLAWSRALQRRAAEHRSEVQGWQLRQLVPGASHEPA